MASSIRANCTICGEVIDMPGTAYTVYVGPRDEPGVYAFTCSKCGEYCEKPAGRTVIDLFSKAQGVKWVYPPAELDEVHLGPALTADDLLDFCVSLYGADDATILARAVL